MVDLEQLIRCEVYRALEHLGAPPKVLAASINGASKEAMYAAAERLGADRYLLGFIGSWHDSMEDAEVLAALRQWNGEEEAEAAAHIGGAEGEP